MSANKLGRRDFLKRATAVTAAVPAAFSFEEQILLAHQQPPGGGRGRGRGQIVVEEVAGPMPMGRLGPYQVSRLIAGHNLVGWQAHARDLIYVSQLLRNYFTDDKVLQTYRMYEEVGINASYLRIEGRSVELAKKYDAQGGKLQWIAQLVINEKDQQRDLDIALEIGAKIGYIRGLEGDRFWKAGRMDVVAAGIENAKKAGMVIGLATHSLDPLIAADKAGGLGADFYMKTFNAAQYWSAGAPRTPDPNWKPSEEQLVQAEYEPGSHDNIWETTPRQTAEFFAKIEKPFVAYKVLGAGAIHPIDGFKYAFANGADFVSVGMYDFQLREDVNVTKKLFADKIAERTRPWRA
ncbi:MAG: twin-arginine translocation signal domain-containing protein [Acidobacteriota bacterium]